MSFLLSCFAVFTAELYYKWFLFVRRPSPYSGCCLLFDDFGSKAAFLFGKLLFLDVKSETREFYLDSQLRR